MTWDTRNGGRRIAAVFGYLALLAAACERAPTDVAGAMVPIRIAAVTVGTPISTLIVEVTASDIPTPLVFNLTVVNGVATGTIKVPPGAARTIRVAAVDDAGNVTHEGSVTLDVRPGQNTPVQIRLAPRSGHVPITVTFGNFAVVVSPTVATIDMKVASQLQLSVTVTDVNGQTIVGPEVGWATTQPAVAAVSATGRVTGMTNGSATIVATHEGVAGLSLVTVIGAATGSPETCDGMDNNLDEQIDEGLRYCINGVAAPHSDGNVCLAGFVDADGNPVNGCEQPVSATFTGVWALTPVVALSCTGNQVFESFFPQLKNPSIDQVGTTVNQPGRLLLEFRFSGFSAFLEVSLNEADGTFGGSGSTPTSELQASITIDGAFTGPDAFTARLALVNISINIPTQAGPALATCLDVDQTVSGDRVVS